MFALLRDVIGPENPHYLLNQSNACYWLHLNLVFTLRSHWLLEKFFFPLIGCCDNFGFCFTTADRNAFLLQDFCWTWCWVIVFCWSAIEQAQCTSNLDLRTRQTLINAEVLRVYVGGRWDWITRENLSTQRSKTAWDIRAKHFLNQNLWVLSACSTSC